MTRRAMWHCIVGLAVAMATAGGLLVNRAIGQQDWIVVNATSGQVGGPVTLPSTVSATGPATQATTAPAATIYKVDDSTVAGDPVAFDGRVLTLQLDHATGGSRKEIALEDIVRIELRASDAESKRAAATQAAEAAPAEGAHPNWLLSLLGISSVSAGGGPAPAAADAAPASSSAPTPAAQPTTSPSSWYLKCANGDSLHGGIATWVDQKLTLRLDGAGEVAVTLPAAALTEMWRATPEQVAKAKALQATGEPNQDTAYVLKETDKIVAVAGSALGMQGSELLFRYDGSDRKIAMSKLLGVVFAPAAQGPQSDKFHQAFMLVDGDVISGKWIGLNGDDVALDTGAGGIIHLRRDQVASIECRNGRVVYLSDLRPVKVEQTPYFDRLMPYRTDTSLTGDVMRLSDGTHAKGLAVHSRCVLEYDLGGRFERFRAKVGFEQPQGLRGRAAVRAVADGRTLLDNPDARGDQAPIDLDADVKGVQRLVLEVDFGQGQDVGGRVDWADARLLRAHVGADAAAGR
jgi:hypothetical protein